MRLAAPGNRTAGILLALLLLSPYGSAFLLLPRGDSPTCGMSCCVRSKECCCRKASRKGPGWSNAPKCFGGCAQTPAVRGTAAALPAATRQEGAPVLPVVRVRTATRPAVRASETNFSLFERPPPIPA